MGGKKNQKTYCNCFHKHMFTTWHALEERQWWGNKCASRKQFSGRACVVLASRVSCPLWSRQIMQLCSCVHYKGCGVNTSRILGTKLHLAQKARKTKSPSNMNGFVSPTEDSGRASVAFQWVGVCEGTERGLNRPPGAYLYGSFFIIQIP